MDKTEHPSVPSVPAVANSENDLEWFEAGVHGMLEQLGLPTQKLLAPVAERAAVIRNMPGVLNDLDDDRMGESYYVSKMIAAATVGLFDAALNYLWDELVSELRARVIRFDLNYFFDIASKTNNDMRKDLNSEKDLAKINDAQLLRAVRDIGLISDLGYKRLDHIRYMRNHASAAHPSHNDLTGLELVSFLNTCVREVINTPPDTVAADVKRLLSNIRNSPLEQAAVDSASAFFDRLPPERADNLANGLFGLYTSSKRTPTIADNVRLLWPNLWPFVGEATRNSYGLRHARAAASAETDFAAASRELIDLVDGTAYLTPEVRAVELSEALEVLSNVHQGMNNFYNEPAPARRVLTLVGEQGDVPESVRESYVRTIVECYLGNGYGVSNAALPSYEKMVARFSSKDAGYAMRLCMEPFYSSLLGTHSGGSQWILLLDALEPKLISATDRNLMAGIRAFAGTADQLRLDAGIKKLAATEARAYW
ncbi:hypothetical protein [Actinomyces lilanjuaniae]|uniref:hypothetical protein n=1 Tax=Actinomyces lilanjuaniae TaxID=2321394 RepID=UPI0013C42EF2|nr:hypothetical protein [Actinomyces lilanjuaniae]